MATDIKLFQGVYSAKTTTPENMVLPDVTVESVTGEDTKAAIVAETMRDFERRRRERHPFELQWRIIQNYIAGNQFVDADNYSGRLVSTDEDAPTNVYNKMAPIYQTRVSKLANVRPMPITRPVNSENVSVLQSQLTTKLLNATYNQLQMQRIQSKVTMWSELVGTGFYKVGWDSRKGRKLGTFLETGEDVYDGGITVTAHSPFEIYPDYETNEEISDMRSIIHAQALPADVVNEQWNVNLEPETTWIQEVMGADIHNQYYNMVDLTPCEDFVLVIEKFEMPSKKYPSGRHIVISQNNLLYYGALPYLIGEDGKPSLPFVKQVSERIPGHFWGGTINDRLRPIQKQYNRVRNDIADLLSRIGQGVYDAVEGAYNVDLADGLKPGMILIRNPGFDELKPLQIPEASQTLIQEVTRLEQDFVSISGVSEYSVYSQSGANASGVQLDMLSKADDSRLRPPSDSIRDAVVDIGKMWIRLYRQFATGLRITRMIGDDNTAFIQAWEASDLTTDDVVLDSTTDMSQSPAERKQAISELLQYGLFKGPDGMVQDQYKPMLMKIFEMEDNTPISTSEKINLQRAQNENFAMRNGEPPMLKLDDNDDIHIVEHTKFELEQDIDVLAVKNPEIVKWVYLHIEEHRQNKLEKQKRDMEDQIRLQAAAQEFQSQVMPQQPVQQPAQQPQQ